nr:hypothetical protein CFP56_62336 [Quercus suber]
MMELEYSQGIERSLVWQMLFVASAIKFQIYERDYGDVQELFDDLIQRLTEEDFDLFAITAWHILVQSQ